MESNDVDIEKSTRVPTGGIIREVEPVEQFRSIMYYRALAVQKMAGLSGAPHHRASKTGQEVSLRCGPVLGGQGVEPLCD